MIASLISPLFVILAYLIGAIPFGFLIARAVAGIDIRTVGSGNIGATNVGRTLGFRWFVVVFALDFAKGMLPTLAVPYMFQSAGYGLPAWLPVMVGFATILGHNFPIYLKFKGGKGVATSLGVLMALEPLAGLIAATGFVVFLLLTKYVSISSVLGGVLFASVYFGKTAQPFDSDHIAMSVVTLVLLVMVIARHRHNFQRIGAGTEPKVMLGKKREPRGKIVAVLVPILAIGAASALFLSRHLTRGSEVVIGSYRFHEVTREATGHQRVDRLSFAAGGKILGVNCPRYNRVVIYNVTANLQLNKRADISLEGRPVAIISTDNSFLVLQRPALNERHFGPGWFDTFDFNGKPIHARRFVGYDPDDFALVRDTKKLLILHSGRAEGEADRPDPDLTLVDLDSDQSFEACPRVIFDQRGDDPDRIRLSSDGRTVVVTFRYSNKVAKLEIGSDEKPHLLARLPFDDNTPLAENPERETLMLAHGVTIQTLPDNSAFRIFGDAEGVVPLFGPLRLNNVRPNGMAVSRERNLIAIASKAGSVHLIAAEPLSPAVASVAEADLK